METHVKQYPDTFLQKSVITVSDSFFIAQYINGTLTDKTGTFL
ncbi:hypothetical protein [Anaerocolumna sp. MB42-C2]|nr:hypothetical protein [Anaerocolumna sp. MB42-C2]WMJ86900.1 hypothetical protein RBU59_23145 [Anaerocolumna sp. MB42-C2]